MWRGVVWWMRCGQTEQEELTEEIMKQFLEQEAVLESSGAGGGSTDPEEMQVRGLNWFYTPYEYCSFLRRIPSRSRQWDSWRAKRKRRSSARETGRLFPKQTW